LEGLSSPRLTSRGGAALVKDLEASTELVVV